MKGDSVEKLSEGKYLGIILDSQLNFKSHVKKSAKPSNINCYRIIRQCLTFECAEMFLNSLILSHLSYGATVWSQTHQTNLRPLETLYNHAFTPKDN